jgi:Protein of unknown function (DUF2439)
MIAQRAAAAEVVGHPLDAHCQSTNNNQHAVAGLATTTATAHHPQFACLYTKHKTQKHKIWRDGRLLVNNYSCRLHDADPQPGSGDPMLDSCPLDGREAQAILSGQRTDMETEKFLISIDGPWKSNNSLTISNHVQLPLMTTANNTTAATSKGMAKLLQTKFREPKRAGPPPPPIHHSIISHAFLAKRQRPLQPGELQNRYYGSSQPPPTHPSATSHDNFPPSQQNNMPRSNGQDPSMYPPMYPPRPPPPPPPRQMTSRPSDFVSQQFSTSSFYEEEEQQQDKTRLPLAARSRIRRTTAPAVNGDSPIPHSESSISPRFQDQHEPATTSPNPHQGYGYRNPANGHRIAFADDRCHNQSQQYSPRMNERTPRATSEQQPEPHSQVDVSWFDQPAASQEATPNTPPPPVTARSDAAAEKPPPPPPPQHGVRPRSTNTIGTSHRHQDCAFAANSDFRASQYYEEEEEEEEETFTPGVPQAFMVPTIYPTHDTVSRSELLDIFSDQPEPSTALPDEFVLPDNSSSDEE